MQIALLFVWSIYLIFLALVLYGWLRKSRTLQTHANNNLTVIIPLRNEEKNLSLLVRGLKSQTYRSFSVIFVNDHSEDNSTEILTTILADAGLEALVINLEDTQGKKAAIEAGIEAASGNIIVTTDADCQLNPKWLECINSGFEDSTQVVAGPVTLEGEKSFFNSWQRLEFSTLIGTGGAMIKLGIPVMCNGANLAYRKSAFEGVGGFDHLSATPSGDDELLMHKINQAFPNSVRFLQHKDSSVITTVSNGWSEFVGQRKRWSSKWRVNRRPATIILALLIFLFQLSFLAMVVLTAIGSMSLAILGGLLAAKLLMELLFALSIKQKIGGQFGFTAFLVSQIFYPFYAIYFGLVANFGKYQWKGRTYKV